MRLIILFSFIGIVLSNSIPLKNSLNSVYEKTMNSLDQGYSFFDKLKDTNHECIKEKLKLPEIGEKKINVILGKTIIRTAAVMCNNDKNVAYEKILRYFSQKMTIPGNVECYKKRLHELEADSKFLKDFDSTVNCETTVRKFEPRKEMLQDLGVYDCVISKNVSLEKTGIKVMLSKKFFDEANGMPEDVKNEMFKVMDSENEILVQCSLEQVE